MSGIISTVGKAFGLGGSDVPNISALDFPGALRQLRRGLPREFTTGRSTVGGGEISLDPSIRAISDETLGGFRGLRDRLGEGRGAFIEARMAPLEREIESRRGGLTRELGRTGVRGTFRNQALNRFGLESASRLGEARALGEQEQIGAEAGVLGEINRIGVQRFDQELQSIGLPADISQNLARIAANLAANRTNASVRAGGLRDEQSQGIFENISGFTGGLIGEFEDRGVLGF